MPESSSPVGSSARINCWPVGQRASDGQALLLPAGKLVGAVMDPFAQSNQLQAFYRAIMAVAGRRPGDAQDELDIFIG